MVLVAKINNKKEIREDAWRIKIETLIRIKE